MAETVIGRLLLRVLQNVIGFVDFLELVLGRLVARIGIGMKLLGELAVGGLEFLLVGALADAQNLVKIALGHGCHYHDRTARRKADLARQHRFRL